MRPGNVHSADGWEEFLSPIVDRYKESGNITALEAVYDGCRLRLSGIIHAKVSLLEAVPEGCRININLEWTASCRNLDYDKYERSRAATWY